MKKQLFLILYLLLTGCTVSNSLTYGGEGKPKVMKINILDQQSIHYEHKNKIPFSEISDLSYDLKNHKLYMIGDKGYFYTFDANFTDKIAQLDYKDAVKIHEKKKHPRYDSEGLTHDDKGKLFISFEQTPRIANISTAGYVHHNKKLMPLLQNKNNYRSSNKMFEALAWHPTYGLLTAAEYPLNKKKNHQQSIYALSGKKWDFLAQKHKNNAITAIEVMNDGNLLILERAYSGFANPFVITLTKLYLDTCDTLCKTEVLASFNSKEGWGVNNYEGLTRVDNNRYLMISDDNNNRLLRTVLVYFEVNDD